MWNTLAGQEILDLQEILHYRRGLNFDQARLFSYYKEPYLVFISFRVWNEELDVTLYK